MDELNERGVLILSLWFVSIVSLLLMQYVPCNFSYSRIRVQVWKCLSECDILSSQTRVWGGGNEFVHCFYIN